MFWIAQMIFAPDWLAASVAAQIATFAYVGGGVEGYPSAIRWRTGRDIF